jgi:putative oxidoreductase
MNSAVSLSRTIARPLLAAIFIYDGWDAIRNPTGKIQQTQPLLPIAEKVPVLPQDAEKLVRINGAVMVGAGTLMALGKFRRLAALALIGSIIPSTYAGHRFWEEEDEATKAQQRIHFLKNLGLLGGLILEAFDTEGSPSLRWRATHRGRRLASSDDSVLAEHIRGGIGAAQEVLSHVAEVSVPAVGQARETATRLPEMSNRAWRRAQQRAAQIDTAQQKAAIQEARAAIGRAADSYRAAATRAQKRAAKVDLADQKVALKEAQRALRQAMKRSRVKARPVLAQSAQALRQAKSSAQPVLDHSAEALHQAGANTREVFAEAAKALQQGTAHAQPVLSSAASRAANAWAHLPTGD